jgi:DNA-binding response OmpR family regulator
MDKKILYIEDDSDMKDLVAEILSYDAYEVITDSGKNIFQILKTNSIGLILMDEKLGWCWGSDLCRELRANQATIHIPIIMISAANEIDIIAQNSGAIDFIKKPFEMYDVIDKVTKHYPKHF